AGSPGWCDYEGAFYGHGELGGLGVEVAPDVPGDDVDPDRLERLPRPENERLARAYAARRFPSLADAPVVGARVCQYDLTADAHFLVARHPERPDWWLVGGGSGRGSRPRGSAPPPSRPDGARARRRRERAPLALAEPGPRRARRTRARVGRARGPPRFASSSRAPAA